MIHFFKKVRSSIYNPSFYQSLREASVSSSIKYFAALSVIGAILTVLLLIPGIAAFFSPATVSTVVGAYPADLEVTVDHGVVSINQPEPYIIKDSEGLKKKNILVIDTKSNFTGAQFDQYSTYVLVKKDFVVVEDKGAQKIFPLNEVQSLKLNQERVAAWGQKALPLLVPGAIALTTLLLLAIFIGSMFSLVYFLLLALIMMLIGRARHTTLSYKEAYKVTVHAATLPLIMWFVFTLAHISMPFLTFSLLTLLVAFLNLKPAPNAASPTSTE
jgi:hypothetical protein